MEKLSDQKKFGLSRRGLLKGVAGAALATPFLSGRALASEVLYVNTWGGRWEESAQKNLFQPFTQKTGIEIRTVSPVSYAKLAAQARTGVYEFDVTTVGSVDLLQAAQQGITEPIAGRDLNLPASSIMGDGVASHVFSTNICYNREKHPNGPQNWAEFWDVEKFRGHRSMYRHAWTVFPSAVASAGVPYDKLYPLDGDLAFSQLDKIKDSVRVWWTQGNQSQQLIRDGEIDFIGIWHGQAQFLQSQGVPLELVWDGAVHSDTYWVVSKGSPRAEAAWKFLEFAGSAEPLAGFCRDANYGPMNPEAFNYIDEAVRINMPTDPENAKSAIRQNAELIGKDFLPLMRRFDQWIAS